MTITFDSQSAVVPDISEVPEAPTSVESPTVDLSIISASRRAEQAEVQLAVERARTARMRYETLRLAEVADNLKSEVAKLQAEVDASRAEAVRMHGVVAATRIEANAAMQDRAALAAEVDSLSTDLQAANAELVDARDELVDLRETVSTSQAKSVVERQNLESAIRLAAEFDELRHAHRTERDAARVEADRNKRLLTAARQRMDELEQQALADRSLEDARLVELAQLAQHEVDEAFAAGSRLGDRAALRVALLEKELVAARQRMKAIASGGCPDPSAHIDRSAAVTRHPSAGPEPAVRGSTLHERIAALGDVPSSGR